MSEIKINKLDKPISADGLMCCNCGQPIDTKTTTTMLCKRCKAKYVAEESARTMEKRYGVRNAMYLPGMDAKIKAKMTEKYGSYCAMTSPGPRAKFEKIMEERYGVKYFVNSDEFVNKSMCKSKINEAFASELEKAGIAFSQEKLVDDKRFDFKIEGTRTYVEIDPTYTHSVAGNHLDKEGLPSDKQLIKTLIAEKHDYRCIHVFDWDNWNSIIKMILPKSVIYARNCTVKEVPYDECVSFVIQNAIDFGEMNPDHMLCSGLYYNGKLVQIMMISINGKCGYSYEISELCTLLGFRIVGGASKLFKYMIKSHNMDSVAAVCDRAKFSGKVFSQLGMKLIKNTPPKISWSKGKQRIKDKDLNLPSTAIIIGEDDLNANKMINKGWLPLHDCGESIFGYGEPSNQEEFSDTNSNHEVELDYSKMLRSVDRNKEKLCEFCGKPFVPRSNFQRYCKRPHYMTCPVCNKPYLVTNNENLKRPPVACSYACRAAKTRKTSLEKYGTLAPGNNPEARKKAKATMQDKYGVDYAMQSEELKEKAKDSLVEKYGVDNIRKLDIASIQTASARRDNWVNKVHSLLPIKTVHKSESPRFKIDETKMSIYILTEKASTSFLNRYGFRYNPKFGKIHLSIGLVNDGILYQVIRFEKVNKDNKIILADFGIRDGYFNPNYYAKLMNFAVSTRNIEQFEAKIPRNIASKEVIDSLHLELVSKGDYEVYWKMSGNKLFEVSDSLVKLTQRDNIEEMLKKYDYITTNYIDTYKYTAEDSSVETELSSEFIIQSEHLE